MYKCIKCSRNFHLKTESFIILCSQEKVFLWWFCLVFCFELLTSNKTLKHNLRSSETLQPTTADCLIIHLSLWNTKHLSYIRLPLGKGMTWIWKKTSKSASCVSVCSQGLCGWCEFSGVNLVDGRKKKTVKAGNISWFESLGWHAVTALGGVLRWC